MQSLHSKKKKKKRCHWHAFLNEGGAICIKQFSEVSQKYVEIYVKSCTKRDWKSTDHFTVILRVNWRVILKRPLMLAVKAKHRNTIK